MTNAPATAARPASDPPAAPAFGVADPRTVQSWVGAGQAVLIDVREPDENARERIAGSVLVPLSRFDPSRIAVAPGQRVVMHCKGGRRSADACRMSAPLAASGVQIFSLEGGIENWKKQGLPVVAGGRAPAISILRQVQLIVGSMVLVGSVLAWLVSPWFLIIPAFFGSGLTFAGATGTCGLALMLGVMPWNRIESHPGARRPS